MSAVCKNVHFHLRALHHIQSSLTDDMATSTAVALIHSRLDYANSFLYGISATNINKLRRCQNTVARLILQQSGTPSVQYLMDRLHWLRSAFRLISKLPLCLTRLSSSHPAYLRELISPYQPSCPLRSSNQLLLTVPHNWPARFLLFIPSSGTSFHYPLETPRPSVHSSVA